MARESMATTMFEDAGLVIDKVGKIYHNVMNYFPVLAVVVIDGDGEYERAKRFEPVMAARPEHIGGSDLVIDKTGKIYRNVMCGFPVRHVVVIDSKYESASLFEPVRVSGPEYINDPRDIAFWDAIEAP